MSFLGHEVLENVASNALFCPQLQDIQLLI